MMLAGFQQYGLVPGPLLFVTNADLVWGLIASFFIGNLMLLVPNPPLVACRRGCLVKGAAAVVTPAPWCSRRWARWPRTRPRSNW